MAKRKSVTANGALLRHATVDDAEQIQKLIMNYARKNEMLPRSLNAIYEQIREFMVVEKKGVVLACVSLHVCWNDLAEIRSLAVAPRHKNKGYGSKLVRQALKEAGELGLPKVFTLTYKPEFFEKLDFERIAMSELPNKVWADCIKCVHFPNCNEVALITEL